MINNTTHDIGKLFWHTISLKKKSSLYHRYPTHEIDSPYRWSNSHILRLPWSSAGLVVGWWHKTTRTEEQALLDAMEGRQMDNDEFHESRSVQKFVETGNSGYLEAAFSDIEKANIRRLLIEKQIDADNQQLLVDALDL